MVSGEMFSFPVRYYYYILQNCGCLEQPISPRKWLKTSSDVIISRAHISACILHLVFFKGKHSQFKLFQLLTFDLQWAFLVYQCQWSSLWTMNMISLTWIYLKLENNMNATSNMKYYLYNQTYPTFTIGGGKCIHEVLAPLRDGWIMCDPEFDLTGLVTAHWKLLFRLTGSRMFERLLSLV